MAACLITFSCVLYIYIFFYPESTSQKIPTYLNQEARLQSISVDMALNIASIRDTKWLTLEVCRQFQRGTCSRSDEECKFAHPPKSCQVENGRVIACFDSLKVRIFN